jgi:hypothetical protein
MQRTERRGKRSKCLIRSWLVGGIDDSFGG